MARVVLILGRDNPDERPQADGHKGDPKASDDLAAERHGVRVRVLTPASPPTAEAAGQKPPLPNPPPIQPLRLDVAATMEKVNGDNGPRRLTVSKDDAARRMLPLPLAGASAPKDTRGGSTAAAPARLTQAQSAEATTKPAVGRTAAPAGHTGQAKPPAFDPDSRPISALTGNIGLSTSDLSSEEAERLGRPLDRSRAKLTSMRNQPYNALADRQWMGVWYLWEAPALCHHPLWFEEVNLERYGYRWPHASVFQPVFSCAQFYANLALLPYRMTGEPSREDIYTLGHYRPGSPAPYQIHFPRWRAGAGTVEGAAAVGLIFLLP